MKSHPTEGRGLGKKLDMTRWVGPSCESKDQGLEATKRARGEAQREVNVAPNKQSPDMSCCFLAPFLEKIYSGGSYCIILHGFLNWWII